MSSSNDNLDSLLMPPPPKRQKHQNQTEVTDFPSNVDIPETITTKSNSIVFPSLVSMEEEAGRQSSIQSLKHSTSRDDAIIIDESCKTHFNNELLVTMKRESNHQRLCKRKKPMVFDKPPIKQKFSDIIGHAPAKLRLDEMLLPLALPPGLSNSILSGKTLHSFLNYFTFNSKNPYWDVQAIDSLI